MSHFCPIERRRANKTYRPCSLLDNCPYRDHVPTAVEEYSKPWRSLGSGVGDEDRFLAEIDDVSGQARAFFANEEVIEAVGERGIEVKEVEEVMTYQTVTCRYPGTKELSEEYIPVRRILIYHDEELVKHDGFLKPNTNFCPMYEPDRGVSAGKLMHHKTFGPVLARFYHKGERAHITLTNGHTTRVMASYLQERR